MKKKIKEVPELFNEKYLYLDNSNFFTRGRVRVLTYADQKVKKLGLKDLKKYGVNLIYGRTGGYPSMEERWIYFDEEEKFRNSKKANETKKIVKEYHRYGIRVGATTGLSEIRQSALDNYPEVADWIAKDKDGKFIGWDPIKGKGLYTPCHNSPKYINYLIKLVSRWNVLGFDMFHLDNPGMPKCFCKYCHQKWTRYIKNITGEKISLEDAIETKSKRLKTLFEEFRYKSTLDLIQKVLDANRKLRKDFKIDANLSCASPISIYILSSNKTVDIICYEWDTSLGFFLDAWEGGVPPESEQIAGIKLYYGATNENIPMILYLISWRKDNRVQEGWHAGYSFLTPSVDRYSLCLAEAITMGVSTNPGNLAFWDISINKPFQLHFEKIRQYYNFIEKYEEIYKAKTYSKIGVFFSPKSLVLSGENHTLPILKKEQAANLNEVRGSYYSIAETLLKLHQSFKVLVEGKFREDELKKCDLVIIPFSPVMGDKTFILLKEFVDNGGILIITDKNAGNYDLFYQLRQKNLLKILKIPPTAKQMMSNKGKIIITLHPNFLGGRFNTHISQNEFNSFDTIVKKNVEEIIQLEGNNNDLVVVEPTITKSRNLVIHLLNYNYNLLPYNASQEDILKREKVIPAKNLILTIKLPDKIRFKKVINISPEHSPKELKYEIENSKLRIKIPEIKIYEIILIGEYLLNSIHI